MGNVARRYEREQAHLETGYITRAIGDRFVVDLGDVRVDALRAAGCLRAPKKGDRVLTAVAGEESFIISVLVAQERSTTIAVDGDLELTVPNGKLGITAQRGVEVHTTGAAELTAPKASMRVIEADAMVDSLRWLGRKIHADVTRVTTVVESVDAMAQRVRQRVDRMYRFIKDFDQLRAGHIDHRAESTVRIHGENTVVTAEGLAKIDGEQIHVG